MRFTLATILILVMGQSASAQIDNFFTDRNTDRAVRTPSPVFASAQSCRAIISRNYGLCDNNDCRAIVLGHRYRCQTTDCEAIVLSSSARCFSSDCRGVVLRQQYYCKTSICRAIISKQSGLCFGRWILKISGYCGHHIASKRTVNRPHASTRNCGAP